MSAVSVVKRLFVPHTDNVDLCNGSIPRAMIRYSLPILFGNLLQYLYNAVDAWVLGQSGQTEAYAAVGSLSSITQTLVALFWGFSQGAGIVISRAYGARDRDRLSRGAHTAVIVTVLIGAFLTVVGMLASPQLLYIVLGRDGDPEIYRHAKTYLLIFFGGIIPMLVYNIGAEIMRAVGNSHYPFVFLCFGSVLNILLDILLVFVWDFGVAGVAWATVISQALAAVLVLFVLFGERAPVRLYPRQLRIDRAITSTVVRLGIPVAIQNSIASLSSVFVQSYIAGANGDQLAILGGYTTFSRIVAMLCQPAAVLTGTVGVFVAQNLGANEPRRARQGVRWGQIMALCMMLPIALATVLLSDFVPLVFTTEPAVVALAAQLFRYLTIFYVVEAVAFPLGGALRGLGRTTVIMLVNIFAAIGSRQAYLYIMANYISNDYLPIVFSIPFGILVQAVAYAAVYLQSVRRKDFEPH